MENFRRSLKYLWPYRLRIGVAVVCVLVIASLWAGGLGLLFPGAKILISDEGLHGWVYKVVADKRLGISSVQSTVSIAGAAAAGGGADRPRRGRDAGRPGWPEGPAVDRRPGRADAPPSRSGQGQADLARSIAFAAADQPRGAARLRPDHPAPHDRPRHAAAAPTALRHACGTCSTASPSRTTRPERLPLFLGLLVVVLVVTIIRAVFTFIQEYLVGTAIWQGIMDLRCENYDTVLRLPTTFFSEKGVSDATSRFIQDTSELARGQNTLLGKTLVEPAKAIGSLVLALTMSWQLTLMALVAGPPAFLLIRRFGKKMHRASRRSLESWSQHAGGAGRDAVRASAW